MGPAERPRVNLRAGWAGFVSKLRAWFGRRGLRLVAGAPILAMLVVGALLPRLTHTDFKATGSIDMYPATGTHAAYDVIGHVVDFSNNYQTGDAARAATDAAGLGGDAVSALLVARREGDSARVRVEFAGPSAEAAEAGLRSASRVALRQTVQRMHDRVRGDYDQARHAFEQLLTDVEAWRPPDGPGSVPGTVVAARRIAAVQRAGQYVEAARATLTEAELSLSAVDGIVDSAVVRTTRISSGLEQSRVLATATLSALVAAIGVVLGIRRKFGPRRWARFLD